VVQAERDAAQRNRPKAALRRASGIRQTATRPAPSSDPTAPSTVLGAGPAEVVIPGTIVEGEKALRTLADTPTSVGIVTGAEVRDRQIANVNDALRSLPNTIVSEGSRGNSGFSIRGLNSEGLTQQQNSAAAPIVSVTVDGATQNPEATRRGARALWDVEQVEVLRGPQSTIQARNALAGAVVVKTNDPTYKAEGQVEGTFGTDSNRFGGFLVNAPLASGEMAVRIAGQVAHAERGIDYRDPANEPLDRDRLANIRGKLLFEPKAVPGLSVLLTLARTDDKPGVSAVTGPDFFDRFFGLPTGSVDFRETVSDNYIADVSYRLAPGLTLRSVGAYAETLTDVSTAAGSPLQRVRDDRLGDDLTQDVRLEITNSGNGLSGVVGLFYGSFTNERDALLQFQTPFGPFTISDLALKNETVSSALYADLRYRFWDRFQVIAGGRLLRDDVSSVFDDRQQGTREASETTFEEALPKAGMTFEITRDQTIGLTYAQGYRAGFTEVTLSGDVNVVAPEFLNSYELSYRSRWFGGRLEVNGNLFHYDYTAQQVAIDDPAALGASIIVNGGASTARGGEIDVRWRPSAAWQVFGSLGFITTKFEDFVTDAGDFSGNEFPEAPAFTLAAGVQYQDPSGWFAGANVRHSDTYFSGNNLANDPRFLVPSYTVVDARVGYEWEKAKVTLFAKNLLDEDYVTSLQSGEATVGDRQLIGVTLTARF
jgi:outer membrane receptor protein involved in Fe transport